MVGVHLQPVNLVTMSRNLLIEPVYLPLVTRHVGATHDEADRLRTCFDTQGSRHRDLMFCGVGPLFLIRYLSVRLVPG